MHRALSSPIFCGRSTAAASIVDLRFYMADFDDVKRLGLELPEVAVSTWYGTPGLKVKSKGFCRMWSDREYNRDGVTDTEVLVVLFEFDEKQTLIDASGGVLFSTDHYRKHGGTLVRLADVALDDLADYLEDSYRQVAPKTLVRKLDEAADEA